MNGWSHHTGLGTVLDLENVDTDQLIPARFMSTPRSEGYGQFLLHDMRTDLTGAPIDSFPINKWPGSTILVTRRNFGSGSSREAAVYALVDFGIRAVIAPSFGDIFASNAVNNGLLPACVTEKTAEVLIARLYERQAEMSIRLNEQIVELDGHTFDFEIDAVWREKLVNGWDDIDLTLVHRAAIADHRNQISKMQPWHFREGEMPYDRVAWERHIKLGQGTGIGNRRNHP